MGFIIEVKNVKDESAMPAACAAAMKQIEDKEYTALLSRYKIKEVWKYGIVFCDKECLIKAERQ